MLKVLKTLVLVAAPVCVRSTQAHSSTIIRGDATSNSEGQKAAARLQVLLTRHNFPYPGKPFAECTKLEKDATVSRLSYEYYALIDQLSEVGVNFDSYIDVEKAESPKGDDTSKTNTKIPEQGNEKPSTEAKSNNVPLTYWSYMISILCMLVITISEFSLAEFGFYLFVTLVVVRFALFVFRVLMYLYSCLPEFYLYRRLKLALTILFIRVVSWWLSEDDDSDELCRSRLLTRWNRIAVRPEIYRTAFMDASMSRSKPAPAHSHPEAAADRSGASCFIDRLARVTGMEAYYVQRSRADERAGRSGCREFYWAKDLNTEPARMEIPEHALVAMVDVDQYIDMPYFLIQHFRPMILYTFQPHAVARNSSNYSFTFGSDNKVQYYVTGGGKFHHVVWNYSTDHIIAVKYKYGVPVASVAYLIDRRQTSDDHELVFLTPLGSWNVWGSLILDQSIYGRRLERLRVCHNGFLRLKLLTNQGMMTCTGKPDSFASAKVLTSVDDTIATISRTSKYDLTMAQVMSFVDGNREAAAVLYEYHSTCVPTKPDVVCPVPEAVRRYQFDPKNYDPAAKASLHAFMTPLVHGAFAPDRTVGNEVRCIEGRVEEVRQPVFEVSPFVARIMNEFVEEFLPVPYMLDPVGIDVVVERQNRPTQRRILAVADWLLPKRVVNMFMKAEAYPNVKDPRAISQINGVDKRDYSTFMYALDPVMKRQPWYAFGKNPLQIAERVGLVASKATTLLNTDFSRFDGHGSNIMRELEAMVLMRAFRREHHPKLLELHRSQYNVKAVGAHGTWYDPGFSRLSGSPETSLMNSVVNAFVAFMTLRMSRGTDGGFREKSEAYMGLGIYGGDDGLTANVDPQTYVRAARSIGQELTCEPVQRGKHGVKFLARIYSPYVWFGELNSTCDVARQIAKLHVTCALPQNVTPLMKLGEKLRSFHLSDSATPIIGDLCNKYFELTLPAAGGLDVKRLGPLPKELSYIRPWNSQYSMDVQYPNAKGDWMLDACELSLPDFDYKKFNNWLNRVNEVQQLLSPPLCVAPVEAISKRPVVIDGLVLPHGTPIAELPKRRGKSEVVDKRPPKAEVAKVETKTPKVQFNDEPQVDRKHLPRENKVLGDVARAKQEAYEANKERKKAAGLWVQKVYANNPDNRRSVASAPESREACEVRKRRNGTWKEKNPISSEPRIPQGPRPVGRPKRDVKDSPRPGH